MMRIFLALLALEATALAEDYGYRPRAPGDYVHDGLYLRVDLGFGVTGFSSDEADASVRGGGATFGLAVGGAVAPNLILYAEVFDDLAFNPTLRIHGVDFDTDDASAGTVSLGGGVAYYFMPANLYLSMTLAATHLQVNDRAHDMQSTSPWGVGASIMFGKEWWVSANWGLGLALQLYGGVIEDGDFTWHAGSANLCFSATYN